MTTADDGAAVERTALAWQRTGLAVVVASVAVLRLAVVRGAASGVVAAVLAALVSATVLVRVRAVPARPGGLLGPAPSTAASIALLGLAAAAVELA